jgi:hypothetical protein
MDMKTSMKGIGNFNNYKYLIEKIHQIGILINPYKNTSSENLIN